MDKLKNKPRPASRNMPRNWKNRTMQGVEKSSIHSWIWERGTSQLKLTNQQTV